VATRPEFDSVLASEINVVISSNYKRKVRVGCIPRPIPNKRLINMLRVKMP
jgi:hypothetical protein